VSVRLLAHARVTEPSAAVPAGAEVAAEAPC